MDNIWLPENIILKGQTVELLPLGSEHFEDLKSLAQDKRIWEFYPFDGTDSNRFLKWLELGMNEKKKGIQYPFVVYHKADQKIVGTTRFIEIVPIHKKLEIGSTWYHPDYWATATNLECKLLMLTFSFETLKAVRVQIRTNVNNIRSRKAIAKIGGQFEGVLRHDALQDDGTNRDSAYFSIIDTEWQETKTKLKALYDTKMAIKD